MEKLISVIIPVYNVEKYLSRCIDSVLKQTYTNYEIILVNDGSTDDSGRICDNYSKTKANIRVIHKENAGLSHARNIGIENATGSHVYFLDSDDYITPDCLQVLYENMQGNKASVSCGSFGFFDDNGLYNEDKSLNKVYTYVGRDACVELLYGRKFYTSSCNILLKREIAIKNLFPIGKFHEDEMTTFRYFLDTPKVVITEKHTYFYYQREGSIMHTFGQPVIDEIMSADYYVEFCMKYDQNIYRASLFKKYNLYHHVLTNYPQLKKYKRKLYDICLRYLRENAFSILMDRRGPIRNRLIAFRYIFKGEPND